MGHCGTIYTYVACRIFLVIHHSWHYCRHIVDQRYHAVVTSHVSPRPYGTLGAELFLDILLNDT